jgi:biotin carboxyl carrier protein
MYKTLVHGTSFELFLEHDTTRSQGIIAQTHMEQLTPQAFKLTMDGVSHIADLVGIDWTQKIVTLRIEGNKYQVQVKEPIDLFLDQIGIKLPTPKAMNNLIAPMPGLVLKVLVEEGTQVQKGDPILILEAMKMENVFKAPQDATIKSIHVAPQQAVEKGSELITFA